MRISDIRANCRQLLRTPWSRCRSYAFALTVLAISVSFAPQCFFIATANEPVAQEPAIPLRKDALPPADALQQFELLPGLQIELAASEPNVVDPVTVRFDHQGQMWVVEMRDYPTGPEVGQPFQGRIKVLIDQDRDGYFETSHLFADSLVFPTGLQPFRDGVIVTLAGEVAYLADTDGDYRCDKIETWFTGFSKDNEQLRANHPTWTLENQIHVASGLRGGEIQSQQSQWTSLEKPVSLAARDFSFSPFGGQWHAVAGNSQYGYFQDDAGRSFVCSNRNPCDLLLADAWQVQNNPLLPLNLWTESVMPSAENSAVYPLVNAWTTSNLHAGQFTAACGVFRYQSDLLSDVLCNDFFACEPTGSLVQRYRELSDGVVPQAVRGREKIEFLASRDPWFRPVDLTDGPDGAIYVVDMHRAVIEHPAWMPTELQAREDLRWGNSAGRIYRITAPLQAKTNPRPFDFNSTSPEQWVSALSSPNRWARITAQRKIAESFHSESHSLPANSQPAVRMAIVQSLRKFVDDSISSQEVTRRHPGLTIVLWLLHDANELSPDDLHKALLCTDANVRAQVVRLLALHRNQWNTQHEFDKELSEDLSPVVRFQWLLEFAPEADSTLIEEVITALRHRESDSAKDLLWISRALSLLKTTTANDLLTSVDQQFPEISFETLQPLLNRLGFEGSSSVLLTLIDSKAAPDALTQRLEAFADGLVLRGKTWDILIAELPPLQQAEAAKKIRGFVNDERKKLVSHVTTPANRLASLRRAGLDRSSETLELCQQFVGTQYDDLFIESLSILKQFQNQDLGVLLLERLNELPPRSTLAALNALIDNPRWTVQLLDALETGAVPWGLIDPTSLGRLERSPHAEIAARVQRLLAGRNTASKEEILQRYAATVLDPPNLVAGKQHFVKHCASCHRLAEEGFVVGPDISDMRTQSPEQILTSILDPNRAIDANFFRYVLLTDDGQVIEGLLEESNATSVTLKAQEGIRRTVLREQVEELRATGVSMMPDGFENQLDSTAMRDLIGYVKRWRLMSGEIPLGQ
jgi:putative membrane-bound dehydrogenase-like protein